MYLDYSKLEFDKDGILESPELVLKTMNEETIGVIPGVSNLKLGIKFSEPSTIQFDVAAAIDGEPNWIYDRLTGYKIIYTKNFGIYMITAPTKKADGINDTKHIEGFSLEYSLNTKKFFIEEGTFKFYDALDETNEDTVIGRILEIATGWHIGYISPTLAQKYRTFDEYDNFLLPFMYEDAKKKYHCIFVFDTYERTINAYDADEERAVLPIYLSFDNLLEEIEIEEKADELVTAISPYGADDLNIRPVNPIGTNWLYDLSYFIANGDIPSSLANKWNSWQQSVLANQEYYKGLVALQASATAELVAAQVALNELKHELETLQIQQSVTIQTIALETTDAGKEAQQDILDGINAQISTKNDEIEAQESVVEEIESRMDSTDEDSYPARIRAIIDELSITNYFTDEEYAALSKYFIEQDLTEETFVASTVESSVGGTSYTMTNADVEVSNSNISRIDLISDFNKRMYVLSGGTFAISGGHNISGDIIRGTLEEHISDSKFVMSLYAGSITVGQTVAQSGMITISGVLDDLTSDIQAVTVDEVTTYEGTQLQFTQLSGNMYITTNVSDYQKYSVQMELYDYAVTTLSELATPTYEFSVNSGNFIFSQEFTPFREELELGKGVYLNVDNDEVITPNIIEFELDFEKANNFSVVFSNRFKRQDGVNTLKDMIEKGYSYGRSFDASKYIYNQVVGQTSAVSEFMQSAVDSAVNTIIGARNQSVIINGAGINVSSTDSNNPYIQQFELRIANGMIAMSKDNWQTADLAIGVFQTPSGYHSGINAEVVAGNLVVGNNLIIENVGTNGVMQFKVDSSGAWLNNSTFVLQKDNGGKIIIDPAYGIVAGNGDLFDTNGTTVIPSFIDSSTGDIIFDNEDMPTDSNFFLDINSGNAYFRGMINARGVLEATGGQVGGFTLESDFMHAGSNNNYVALNGSGTNANSTYAIWAGASNPSNANFSVTKAGKLTAKDIDVTGGTISIGNNFSVSNSGVVNASNGSFSGSITATSGSFNGTITAIDGTIGGWTLADGYLYSGSGSNYVRLNASASNNSTYAMWAGATAPGSAPLSITKAGTLNASNVSITGGSITIGSDEETLFSVSSTGEITANSGTFKGRVEATGGYFSGILLNTNISIAQPSEDPNGLNKIYGNLSVHDGALDITSAGGLRLFGNRNSIAPGNIWLEAGQDFPASSSTTLCLYSPTATPAAVASTAVFNCPVKGTSWSNTSDARLKNSIDYDLEKYKNVTEKLNACTFKFNNDPQKTHFGFIAQDVRELLEEDGLDPDDFSIISTSVNEDGESIYHLCYDELIALQQWQIQKLEARIERLESLITI